MPYSRYICVYLLIVLTLIVHFIIFPWRDGVIHLELCWPKTTHTLSLTNVSYTLNFVSFVLKWSIWIIWCQMYLLFWLDPTSMTDCIECIKCIQSVLFISYRRLCFFFVCLFLCNEGIIKFIQKSLSFLSKFLCTHYIVFWYDETEITIQ